MTSYDQRHVCCAFIYFARYQMDQQAETLMVVIIQNLYPSVPIGSFLLICLPHIVSP